MCPGNGNIPCAVRTQRTDFFQAQIDVNLSIAERSMPGFFPLRAMLSITGENIMARHQTLATVTTDHPESVETIIAFLGDVDDASLYTILALQPTKEEFAQAVFHLMAKPIPDTSDPEGPAGKVADICDLLRNHEDIGNVTLSVS